MPAWLLGMLIQLGVALVTRYGIPWVEKSAPYLIPLLEEILKVIKGSQPSKELTTAADHYSMLCSDKVGCPTDLKKT